MSEYTKGKLSIEYRHGHSTNDDKARPVLCSDKSVRVAVISRWGAPHGSDEEMNANAKRLRLCWNSHDALLDALRKYGCHEKDCQANGPGGCNCGLMAAIALAEGEV